MHNNRVEQKNRRYFANETYVSLKIYIVMNALQNHVQLIGRLGQDPEVKQTKNGRTLTRFSLATSEVYKNKQGERVEETQWHPIVIWGERGEIAGKYLRKGEKVALGGKLVHRSYDDAEGNKKYISEVVVNTFMMLSSKEGKAAPEATPAKTVDDLPF